MTFKANWEVHYQCCNPGKSHAKMLNSYYGSSHHRKPHQNRCRLRQSQCTCVFQARQKPALLRIYLRDPAEKYKEQAISSSLHGSLPMAKFYHVGTLRNVTFAITEYLPGRTLRDYLLPKHHRSWADHVKVSKILGSISTIDPSSSACRQSNANNKLGGFFL